MILDSHVFLNESELYDLSLQHLYSGTEVINMAFSTPSRQGHSLVGYTEWYGIYPKSGRLISIAWDWGFRSPDHKFLMLEQRVRTNIMLVDSQGISRGEGITHIAIVEYLNSFKWQDTVIYELASCYHSSDHSH